MANVPAAAGVEGDVNNVVEADIDGTLFCGLLHTKTFIYGLAGLTFAVAFYNGWSLLVFSPLLSLFCLCAYFNYELFHYVLAGGALVLFNLPSFFSMIYLLFNEAVPKRAVEVVDNIFCRGHSCGLDPMGVKWCYVIATGVSILYLLVLVLARKAYYKATEAHAHAD